MKKGILLFSIGLVLFMVGMFVATLLSIGWIITGTLMAVIGGGLLGISSHFIVSTSRNIHN
ncbi:hypothetical protein [Sporosarcina sp. D27]|uniref:hypothetical protein n=1 Tax=Sporosarcina sp. D27 TaxID=1382305 RepID=UPI000470DD02|nr:hypothetical protein [Sporosarcina sp. D27]